ncbi:MAG: HEAT repeat domain-containing protein [Thermoguttaceae bacterium]
MKRNITLGLLTVAILSLFAVAVLSTRAERPDVDRDVRFPSVTTPYQRQVEQQLADLDSPSADVRAGAAEALAYLRAYGASDALIGALRDEAAGVRREAAMALAWCGGREAVGPLIDALSDDDWVTAQAACVSLNNLTGMQWPFDAMRPLDERAGRIDAWRRWWADVPNDRPATDVLELVHSEDDEQRLRGVRALGSLGGDGATHAVVTVLDPFREAEYRRLDPLEKHLVQSCLRSLGRLKDRAALETLLDFFAMPAWARYAADALGDVGSDEAVGPLIAAYPKYSRDLNSRTKNPELCPADDRFSGDNTQDRMHETPYAIAVALSRLPLDNPDHIEALRAITPYLLANLPSDWDGGMLYEPEAFELVTAYLLDRAGTRQAACDAAFRAAAVSETWLRQKRDTTIEPGMSLDETLDRLAMKVYGDVPYVGPWLPALCREPGDVPRLIGLLEHDCGWLRINGAKALMFMGAQEAVEPMARLLEASHAEAEYGFSGALEHAEYNSPAPRSREALIRGLGRLGATQYDSLLIRLMQDERNVVDIQHAAALALDELDTPAAVDALARAEADHPLHSIRMVAREAIWRRGIRPVYRQPVARPEVPKTEASTSDMVQDPPGRPEAVVFIKGNKTMRSDFNGQAGVDPWRQTYSITNSGPTMRVGRNLYTLRPVRPDGKVTPLTHFTDGFVADCEVSWDGRRILFSRRLNGEDRHYGKVPHQPATLKDPSEPLLGGPDDPWWHVWEINVDGTGLRQITFGPYHDVQPAYLPDDRIVFSSSRIGLRDEYHGYPCTGLTVMNADGTDIHPIGFNLGGDREPAVLNDGRIIFSRLDNFYSRLKTELTVQVVFPDGTKNIGYYGPERRDYWREIHTKSAAWAMRTAYGGSTDNRNRVLRLSQPQPFGRDRAVCTSSGGLVLIGPGRYKETKIPHDRKWAVTSPFPLDDERILCAATIKQFDIDGRIVTCGTEAFERLQKGPALFRSAVNIDLGLYIVDAATGEMELLYNDPESADFEARPLVPRRRPPVRSEAPQGRMYTARLFCNSARLSREPRTATRGKLVRVIEGMPVLSRHETQQNLPTNRWKNHGGTHARVLGTMPLAADGSFFVEVPADRLLHLQVLDADRRVVNNQTFWLYARPGETHSCIGCHERPDTTQTANRFPSSATVPPVEMLPTGGEFSYRAKAWLKGVLPDECEERARTVRAVNLIGRY